MESMKKYGRCSGTLKIGSPAYSVRTVLVILFPKRMWCCSVASAYVQGAEALLDAGMHRRCPRQARSTCTLNGRARYWMVPATSSYCGCATSSTLQTVALLIKTTRRSIWGPYKLVDMSSLGLWKYNKPVCALAPSNEPDPGSFSDDMKRRRLSGLWVSNFRGAKVEADPLLLAQYRHDLVARRIFKPAHSVVLPVLRRNI